MPDPSTKHYFVDEAGDLTLFNRQRIIVGTEGVSHLFMVGLADIPDPDAASTRLERLRRDILADPYFANVPSLKPAARKTAITFHAKDDLPEIRREVIRLLPELGAKVIVAMRRKRRLAEEARASFQATGAKFAPDRIYDDLVERIFIGKLHTADENRIIFARRGKTERNEALAEALAGARRRFERKWRKSIDKPTTILSRYPSESAGLQVIDYYLWALQRLFERREDRFFAALAPQYRLVMDLDDTRQRVYGEWFSDNNPLRLDTIEPVTSG